MKPRAGLFFTAISGVFFSGAFAYAQERREPVEVQIAELKPSPAGVNITLRDVNSRKSIRMMIGFSEGESIMQGMHERRRSRPMTHDLMKNFLDRNGWKVERVLIRDLVRGTFRANLILTKEGDTQVFDSRPSDAIAIAVRSGAKIYVNEEVFEQQQEYEESPDEAKPSEPESLRL
jgi:bifunctional DNase/RNase